MHLAITLKKYPKEKFSALLKTKFYLCDNNMQ